MDTFSLTILIIVVTTLVVSYLKRISKDKCLKSFEGFIVTLEMSDGAVFRGKLEVESTGMELIYTEQSLDGETLEMSHILYKDEYSGMKAILRYHDELTQRGIKKRIAALEKTYHPNIFRKMRRKIVNFFKLIKDSLMEIANTLSGKIKESSSGSFISGNEKYTSRINQELINTIDASYDPLLEKYIGNVVVIYIKQQDGVTKLSGILKEYTQNYLELLDVKYHNGRICDAVFPRKTCDIRGLGESGREYCIFSFDYEIRKYKRFFKKVNVNKRNKNG